MAARPAEYLSGFEAWRPVASWPALLSHLREQGIRIGPEHELRVASLFQRLASQPAALDDGDRVAIMIAAVLATDATTQELVRRKTSEWFRTTPVISPATKARVSAPKLSPPPKWFSVRMLGVFGAGVLALLLLALVNELPSGGGPGPSPQPDATDPDAPVQSQIDDVEVAPVARIGGRIAAGLTPFLACVLVIWLDRRRNEGLSRRLAAPAFMERLTFWFERAQPVPLVGPGAASRSLVREMLRRIETVSHQIDERRSSHSAARNFGWPKLIHRTHRLTPEYVLFADLTSDADHANLLADALTAMFRDCKIPLTRYDFYLHPGRAMRVRLLDLRRQPAEPLDAILARHAGQAFLVLSSGERLVQVTERRIADAAQRIVGAARVAQLMTLTPRDRWGAREQLLQAAGFQVTECNEAALRRLANTVSKDSSRPVRISELGDSLLDSLASNAGLFTSDIAPDELTTRTLIRRLKAYMGDRSHHKLLVSVAAFPIVHPSVTYSIAARAGVKLTPEIVSRLSRLLWVRQGRFPDWLRRALFDDLSPQERTQVRSKLLGVIQDVARGEEGRYGTRANQTPMLLDLSTGEQVLESLEASDGALADPLFLDILNDRLDTPVRPEIARAIRGNRLSVDEIIMLAGTLFPGMIMPMVIDDHTAGVVFNWFLVGSFVAVMSLLALSVLKAGSTQPG